jgi:hypothetical protein
MHQCGTPSLALRIDCDSEVVIYMGNTEWAPVFAFAEEDPEIRDVLKRAREKARCGQQRGTTAQV